MTCGVSGLFFLDSEQQLPLTTDNEETMLKTAEDRDMTIKPNVQTKRSHKNRIDFDPISEELVVEFSEWIDNELDLLEERFASFITKSTIKTDIKHSRS